MKKLFMFLAVAGLATFGVSCSSDDNSSDSGKKDLVVTSDKTEVEEGDAVTFTVKSGETVIEDADLLIGKTKIEKVHTFEKEGTYQVKAQKEGYNESKLLVIKVSKKDSTDPDKKTFTLTVDKAEVKVGETVTFSAKENNVAISGFKVKEVGGAELPGLTWKAEKEGVVKFIATKEGYNDTAEVTVNVKKDEEPENKDNFVTVNGEKYSLHSSDLSIYTNSERAPLIYTLQDGRKVLRYILYSNFNEKDFTYLELAVVLPEGSTKVVYPQDVPKSDVLLLDTFVAINGNIAAELEENESISLGMVWGEKPTEETLGDLAYNLKAKAFEIAYEGEYDGLYAFVDKSQNQKGLSLKNFNSKKEKVVNRLVNSDETISLNK